MKVGVIDYGIGNLGSVLRALEELRVAPVLVERPSDLHAVDCMILPGVGNFGDCARSLSEGGWRQAILDEVHGYGRALLGVCVGMQLLADGSDEGVLQGESVPGLGLVPGRVRHLRDLGCALRVPHVGWNDVTPLRSGDHLFRGITTGTDFYFVHSYAFQPANEQDLLARVDYGVALTAAVGRGRVWGTQFHPEKSSRAGFRVLRNFIEGPSC